MKFDPVDGLPTPEALAVQDNVDLKTAEEILTLVMQAGEPKTQERTALLADIIYRLRCGERWEDFRFQLLLDHLPKIIHRMIDATLLR